MGNWFRDAIVYHILIDRFAGYDKSADPLKPLFLGGTIRGVTEKLPYLADLGINAIWLSPVNRTTTYHGYHITDFYETEPNFGTEADLKQCIDQAHSKNIRVMLDLVPNHCSCHHPFFQQALNDKRNRYRKWFYFNRFSNDYLCFLHFHDLPKINLDYPEARDHLIGAALHWLNLGVDGFRLDHAVGPSHEFWKTFRSAIRSVNPEAVLIGEAWLEGVGFAMLKTIHISRKYLRWLLKFKPWDIEREYIGEFDGVLDFFFRHRITEFIAWKEKPESFKDELDRSLNHHYKRFPEHYCLPTFIDNHDMNRFLFDAGQNRDKLKTALQLQFSLPQPPILYYGTETGLTHTQGVHWDIPFSDLQARQPMPWEDLDHGMIDFCKELIRERRKGCGL
jgi:glycosidase